ncbi:hypothetical protein [Streptomyces echinatus]|uniref:hypothetical protein n=1 Tax=Streptomyces echinatus TaxID=67293 RepID=UPI0037B999E3
MATGGVGRRVRGVVCAVVAALSVSGCFAPSPPMFGDGSSVPEESARVALPVRPGADGDWALNDSASRLLGQGTTLARLGERNGRSWRLTLPAEFALTSRRPGAPHSALTRDSAAVLVGGTDGRTGPSALAGVDLNQGRLTWQHPLPAGSRVSLHLGGTVVAAACHDGTCRLTSWNIGSGERRWSRTVAGPARVLDGCRADALGPAPGADDHCAPYVVTADHVARVDPDDGSLYRVPALRPPAGTVDRITVRAGRTVLVTAPTKGGCRATVLASGTDAGAGDRGWHRTFVWDQPQARRDPYTGCRWNRTLPLVVDHRMVLPDQKGALVVDAYFGTLRPAKRLAPGAYVVSDGSRAVVRTPGRADRLLDAAPGDDRPVRPQGLGPGARSVGRGFWQDGRRLVLFGAGDEELWEGRSDCRAFADLHVGGTVHYCDGAELVTLRPVNKD